MKKGESQRLNEKGRSTRTEYVGEGGETTVWRSGNFVLKPMEQSVAARDIPGFQANAQEGFNSVGRAVIQQCLEDLRTTYGSIIVDSRIVENPQKEGWFFIQQPFVDLADPEAIIDYFPIDIEDKTQRQLMDFITQWKQVRTKALEGDLSVIFPDVRRNILLTKDEDIVYVDTGGDYAHEFFLEGSEGDRAMQREIAALQCLAGSSVKEIINDPHFADLFRSRNDIKEALQESLFDEEELYRLLLVTGK